MTIFPRKLFASILHERPDIAASQRLEESARLDVAEVFRRLETHAEGLTADEAQKRLAQHGPNLLATDQQVGIGKLLLHAVLNPLVILLTILVVVSFATGDYRAGIVMSAMIVMGVGLKLIQEARADHAAAKLKAMTALTATVIRDGRSTEIAISHLVPGDVVTLAAGDMVPADVRIVSAKDLHVIQSSLTGESMPVEKFEIEQKQASTVPVELTCIVFLAMSRKKVIVKHINAIQNLGAMDVLCTDKTGTLTMDQVILERHCDVALKDSDSVLALAYMNSHFQTGLKNVLDRAVLAHVETHTHARIPESRFRLWEITLASFHFPRCIGLCLQSRSFATSS